VFSDLHVSRALASAFTLIGLAVGFAAGWFIARRHTQNPVVTVLQNSADSSQSTLGCDQADDNRWETVRTLWYVPTKRRYTVDWQMCAGDIDERRVRVTDGNSVLFHYSDDEIVRVETLNMLGGRDTELLVMTQSAGTDDRVSWHIIAESNGRLVEWKPPNYDAPAEKLLRPDEDFCCKSWNFHLQSGNIVLARGIYHKGEGNCCPSRGGVLVSLKPAQDKFALTKIQRISKPEYYRRRSQPFCLRCILSSVP
jgi:hypothetical protein